MRPDPMSGDLPDPDATRLSAGTDDPAAATGFNFSTRALQRGAMFGGRWVIFKRYVLNSFAWSVAHSKNVRAGVPVTAAHVEVTNAG